MIEEEKAEMVNPRCFMDISIGGEMEGRIVVELYKDVVPKTVENFRALCTGEKGISPLTGIPLHYKGSHFRRIIRGSLVQGGAMSKENGVAGESIYGLKFEDENFELKHTRKGIISMANTGPNTNESQFLIVTTQSSHLDGKHVVFGKMIKGFGVLRGLECVAVTDDYYPTDDVVIVDCGEIPQGADDGTINFFKDGDFYPDWPAELDAKPDSIEWIISAVESIKAIGNEYFKKQNFKMAIKKYRKSRKYLDLCWEMPDIDQEQSKGARNLMSQILTNSSICKLKLGDLQGALQEADFAIRENSDNAKAFYRQGQVYMALNNIDAAAESFQKALELEPTDGGIKKELGIAKKRIADRHEQQKKGYAKMFQEKGKF